MSNSYAISLLTLFSQSYKITIFSSKQNAHVSEDDAEALCHRMVLVCGTSTCHMAVSKSKLFIPGVWGPFWSGTLLNYSKSIHCMAKEL